MSASLQKISVKEVEIASVFEESRQLPIVSLQLIFKVSGSIKDGNLSGLANITASLLNEGTKELGSEKFSEQLEERAIHYSSGVGYETFVIHLDSLKENFSQGVKLVKKLLLDPNLDAEVLERVKNRVISSILQKESNFDYIASKELKKLIFKKTPIQNPKIGDIETIKKIELKDIENFIKENLVLSKVLPIIGGDLNSSEVESYLTELLSPLPVGKSEEIPYFELSEKSENIVYKDTKQAYIYFASPLNVKYSSPDEVYKSKMMFFILGASGFGSRLMEKIRVEKGLAYSVYASGKIDRTRSYFTGHLQTKLENLDEAKKIVIDEITKFLEGGATKEELDSAKSFILGSEPLRTETLSSRIGRSFNEIYKDYPLGHSVEELKKIEALTLEELNSFIKEHREILNLSFSIVTANKEEK